MRSGFGCHKLFDGYRGGHVFVPLAACLILASPFAVLLFGHLTLARTWRRNVFLAEGNLLFAFCWDLASFAMRWLQAGWVGQAFFGAAWHLLSGVIKEGLNKKVV